MPLTTSYSFGDIVLVPFPFTDQTGIKKRPAAIISSAACNTTRHDVVTRASHGPPAQLVKSRSRTGGTRASSSPR